MALGLKLENKIYLLTKNLKIGKRSKKHNYVKVKSFFIKVRKKIVS